MRSAETHTAGPVSALAVLANKAGRAGGREEFELRRLDLLMLMMLWNLSALQFD